MSAQTEQLIDYAQRWRAAGHGSKGEVLREAERVMGLGRATLHRRFNDLLMTAPRRRRSDAGTTSLTRDEAMVVSAVLLEHMRKNGKRIKRVATAIDECRALGLIRAQRVNPATGEIANLSTSAISNALRLYNMHPDQILRPAPAISMASLHPNHVWQIDASRCVMYYLPQSQGDNGLRVQAEKEFYKNKPAAQIKAIRESLWRYVVTDHRSGWLYVDYVAGGETAENLIQVFIDAMVRREGEACHGVPRMVMLDPGSANTSAAFKNLCQALQVRLQVNAPGQPRAKGQVEKAQDIVERNFEAMLKTLAPERVQDLEQIRMLAARWRRSFNGTSIMARHGMTRDQAWLHITAEQLIIAPAPQLMMEVSVSAPEARVVSGQLTVSYLGREYDVSHVPGVGVGERLMICRNPMLERGAQAICDGEDGYDVYHVLPERVYDDFGQVVGAPIIGESFARHADTPAQVAAKEIEMLATGTDSIEAAQAARKARSAFLGGRYDPLVLMDRTPVPDHMPRSGTEHAMSQQASQVVLPPLTHIQAAKALRGQFDHWGPRHYEWLVTQYPDGVPADGLDDLVELMRGAMAPRVLQMTRVA